MTDCATPASRHPAMLMLSIAASTLPFFFTACGRPTPTTVGASPLNGDPAKVVMASAGPSSSNPLPGVVPMSDALPGAKSNSPADGTAAVGGLSSSHQGSGGGATGGTPAKTGGDGK